jgi:membrane protease YdiL (CAAX protease family)
MLHIKKDSAAAADQNRESVINKDASINGEQAPLPQYQRSAIRKWWQSIISTYRESLLPLLRMPAAWILLGVWLTGCSILAFSGYSSDVLGNLPVWTIILLLTLLTIPLTAGMPAPQRKAAPSHITKTRWGIQVATLLVVFLFISSLTLIHYKVVQARIPLLSPLANFMFGSFEQLGQAPTLADVWIPVLYFVVPMALLIPLGVRWREIGFGPGYRTWAVILVWSIPMVVLIVLKLASGEKGLLVLLYLFIQNNLRNGFFEEFLFRGPLMSRLNLLFGVFHIATYTATFHGDLLAGIALALVGPTLIGFCFAIIVLRTRNLFASSVIHALLDTCSLFVFA